MLVAVVSVAPVEHCVTGFRGSVPENVGHAEYGSSRRVCLPMAADMRVRIVIELRAGERSRNKCVAWKDHKVTPSSYENIRGETINKPTLRASCMIVLPLSLLIFLNSYILRCPDSSSKKRKNRSS